MGLFYEGRIIKSHDRHPCLAHLKASSPNYISSGYFHLLILSEDLFPIILQMPKHKFRTAISFHCSETHIEEQTGTIELFIVWSFGALAILFLIRTSDITEFFRSCGSTESCLPCWTMRSLNTCNSHIRAFIMLHAILTWIWAHILPTNEDR